MSVPVVTVIPMGRMLFGRIGYKRVKGGDTKLSRKREGVKGQY